MRRPASNVISWGISTVGTLSEQKKPMWLEGEVQVFPDRSTEIVSLEPQYGDIIGTKVEPILDIYRDALRKAFKDTNLNILGVAP